MTTAVTADIETAITVATAMTGTITTGGIDGRVNHGVTSIVTAFTRAAATISAGSTVSNPEHSYDCGAAAAGRRPQRLNESGPGELARQLPGGDLAATARVLAGPERRKIARCRGARPSARNGAMAEAASGNAGAAALIGPSSRTTRLTMPRAGLPVNTFVIAVCRAPLALQRVAVDAGRGRFRAQQERGADLHGGAPSAIAAATPLRIRDAARRDAPARGTAPRPAARAPACRPGWSGRRIGRCRDARRPRGPAR